MPAHPAAGSITASEPLLPSLAQQLIVGLRSPGSGSARLLVYLNEWGSDVKRLTYAVAVLAAVLATALVPMAASATGTGHGHRKCVSLRPDFGFYEGGVVATEVLTVPDSRCQTISVSHIKDPTNPSDRCQTFFVGLFVGGGLTYTEPVTACGPHRTVLADNVPDGTEYLVLYHIDYLQQNIRFKVHH